MKTFQALAFTSLLVLAAGCVVNRTPKYVAAPVFREDLVVPEYETTVVTPVIPRTQSQLDQDLALSVRNEVARYSDLSGLLPNIDVLADQDRVTLLGSVPGSREKELIDTLVRNTPGVVTVNNRLRLMDTRETLQPTGRTDATGDYFNLHVDGLTEEDRRLSQQILAGLKTDAALASSVPKVNIYVSDGRVTLRGIVQTEQQRQAIETTVRNATGSANIRNELMVQRLPR